MQILVVNAGSSSLKLALIDNNDATVAEHELDAPHSSVDADALAAVLGDGLSDADAVGHRIVHGGRQFREAVRVDRSVEDALRKLVDLAPLHQPKSLAALEAVSAALPDVPAVACFDTAFHATLPAAAATYALPEAWGEKWGVRRYGFHGLSHAWIARRVPELLGNPTGALRVVSCHLGAGASLCAIANRHSVDTTMGFTPLEGLVMATRSGSVDPGLVLWLLQRTAMTEPELANALEHESGMLGLAGTGDMRQVLARAREDDERAQLALDVYVHRLCGAIAAMTAALGGLDALAFTGGVGEHAAEIRTRAVGRLGFLQLAIDHAANADRIGDRDISDQSASARTLVVHAREDLEIARQTRQVLNAAERT